ncbi:amino acid permease [Candidatus Woesearchaeota archaeon]|nr:amino acid permease [Candidatus Woesearchaeota archaeon]
MAERLEKTLSYPVLLIIIVNSIMGTGIFLLPAVGARVSGVASLISWVILSIFAVYISACMGELTGMFPKEGGVYEFSKQAYGRFISFIVGWSSMVASFITIAMLIVGAVQVLLPVSFVTTLWGMKVSSNLIQMLVSMIFILIFHYTAFRGLKFGATMLIVFGYITLGTLIAVIIPGFFHIDPSNFTQLLPEGSNFVVVYLALFFIAETFFGWEQATFLAGETKNGETVVPKALVVGTLIIAIFVFLLAIVGLGVIHSSQFGLSKAPVPDIARIIYGDTGWSVFTILVYVSIIGSVAGWITSSPRLLLAMANDKLLFSQVSAVHPKNKSPYKAIMFQCIITAILVYLASMSQSAFEFLLNILVPLVLFQYAMVVIAVPFLRRTMPDAKRPFKIPFPKYGPIMTILFLGTLIGVWLIKTPNALDHFMQGVSFILLGIPVYFLIELYFDPKMIVKVNDRLAYLALLFEKVSVPKKVVDEILYLLGEVKGKTILEYGCNVGTLTVNLSKAVGTQGKVIATDLSKIGLHITQRRIERALMKAKEAIHGRVHIMHDDQHTSRVHPDIKSVDAIVSVGTISYVQDIKKVLSEMYDILPDEGKIIIVEYADYLRFVPNIEWMEKNETIQDLFMESGFSIRVIRKEGLFWNYVYIYGIKYTEDVVPFI